MIRRRRWTRSPAGLFATAGSIVVLVVIAFGLGDQMRTPTATGGSAPSSSASLNGTEPGVSVSLSSPPRSSPPTPSPTELLAFSGSGTMSSKPFTASGDRVQLSYRFDCSATGAPGKFVMTFYDQNLIAMDSVNETLRSGSDSEIVYISNTSQPYHVDVNSNCRWAISVTGDL